MRKESCGWWEHSGIRLAEWAQEGGSNPSWAVETDGTRPL